MLPDHGDADGGDDDDEDADRGTTTITTTMMMALVLITLILGLFPNTVLHVTQTVTHDISSWFAAGVIAAAQAS